MLVPQEGSPSNGQSDAAFREYVEWYKVTAFCKQAMVYWSGKTILDRSSHRSIVSIVQARVQQLAPLLVQAQFDVSSEAGKKITTIWAALVSRKPSSERKLLELTRGLWHDGKHSMRQHTTAGTIQCAMSGR
jgi:hypothetical protein